MDELLVFDLDNTLAISKTVIDKEMSYLLGELLQIKKVSIITGGSFRQIEKEVIFNMKLDTNFSNLHLFPTDGTAYYAWIIGEGKWQKIYQESLDPKDKVKIINAFNIVLKEINFDIGNIIGELIEDRESAITFSGLGQEAKLADKEKWDPDNTKRAMIKKLLDKKLPDFEIRIAGTTSIDVTAKGLDKAYGIKKMIEYIKVPLEKMTFIGDSLFIDGNDSPVIATGIKTIAVKNPEESKKIIRDILLDYKKIK